MLLERDTLERKGKVASLKVGESIWYLIGPARHYYSDLVTLHIWTTSTRVARRSHNETSIEKLRERQHSHFTFCVVKIFARIFLAHLAPDMAIHFCMKNMVRIDTRLRIYRGWDVRWKSTSDREYSWERRSYHDITRKKVRGQGKATESSVTITHAREKSPYLESERNFYMLENIVLQLLLCGRTQ